MKPPILHIGQPKTGTSALQRFLLLNRKKLFKHGFYYPSHRVDVNGVSSGHASFFQLLKLPRVSGVMWLRNLPRVLLGHAKYRCWILKATLLKKRLILSSEAMTARPAAVNYFFPTATVVAFYRAPASKLVASYNQMIKRAGRTTEFNDFIEKHVRSANKNISGEVFFQWAKRFGKDNLTILPYHREAFPEGKLELAFLKAIGIKECYWSEFDIPEAVLNSSLPQDALEFKRLINHLQERKLGNTLWKLDKVLQRYSDSREKRAAVLLKQEQLRAINCAYSDTVSKVERHFIDQKYWGLISNWEQPTQEVEVSEENIGKVIEYLAQNDRKLFREVRELVTNATAEGRKRKSLDKLAEQLATHDA